MEEGLPSSFSTPAIFTKNTSRQHITMLLWPDESSSKRRKVRHGTHSCHECRRRKVNCLYTTPDSTTCIVCERRGTQCISQYDFPGLDDVAMKTQAATLGSFSTPVSTASSTSSAHWIAETGGNLPALGPPDADLQYGTGKGSLFIDHGGHELGYTQA